MSLQLAAHANGPALPLDLDPTGDKPCDPNGSRARAVQDRWHELRAGATSDTRVDGCPDGSSSFHAGLCASLFPPMVLMQRSLVLQLHCLACRALQHELARRSIDTQCCCTTRGKAARSAAPVIPPPVVLEVCTDAAHAPPRWQPDPDPEPYSTLNVTPNPDLYPDPDPIPRRS